MFDRPESGEQAVLVHIDFAFDDEREELEEFKDLARSAGAHLNAIVTGSRNAPHPKYFVGTGKLDQLKTQVVETGSELVLFNHTLSPSQERNLEHALGCRVVDRTGLILDIFSQRAQTHEGRLQVELAQLKHLSTRLVRGWTHLERQKGGIGLRGPGETQLETDRRLINVRIKQLNKRLSKVARRREQSRRSRRRAEMKIVSLVGYTNAGKSTLFNSLSKTHVFAANQLFATLDPTHRRVKLPNQQWIILSDTVGFIRHLPHQLVASFRSTLEGIGEADLLIHVIDANNPEFRAQMDQVNLVLTEIGAEKVPQIEVFNKIDLIADKTSQIEVNDDRYTRIWLSANTSDGLDLLLNEIQKHFNQNKEIFSVCIPPSAGHLRSKLYEISNVLAEQVLENNELCLTIEIERNKLGMIRQIEGFSDELFKGIKLVASVA